MNMMTWDCLGLDVCMLHTYRQSNMQSNIALSVRVHVGRNGASGKYVVLE